MPGPFPSHHVHPVTTPILVATGVMLVGMLAAILIPNLRRGTSRQRTVALVVTLLCALALGLMLWGLLPLISA